MPGFNPFRYRFPYTNINDINLDWIIKRVKALSEAVSHIDISRIDEIAQQAETALTTAQSAETTAQSAETTANSVQGIANNALTTAQSAETTAQSAETTAQSAETTANSVQGIANNALTTAQSAETTANQAATTAHDAAVIADNASYYASSALNVANGKADKVSGATLGNFASLAANGNLLDSGHSSSDFAAAAAAVPAGGATGQVLTKTSSADYAAAWQTPSGGGGDVSPDMIGIVITGARPAVAVSPGQYVIVQNSTITGITDGLYINSSSGDLSPSTDVTAANLTAISDGGLNDVCNITIINTIPLLGAYATQISEYSLVYNKSCCNIAFNVKLATTIPNGSYNFFPIVAGGIPYLSTSDLLCGYFRPDDKTLGTGIMRVQADGTLAINPRGENYAGVQGYVVCCYVADRNL